MIKNEGVRPEGPTTSFPCISCDRSKFKSSLFGPEPRRLAELDEARGHLQEITCADGCTLASFKWGVVAFPEELEPRLRGMVGQTVAVLRLDGYHVRAL